MPGRINPVNYADRLEQGVDSGDCMAIISTLRLGVLIVTAKVMFEPSIKDTQPKVVV